MSSIRLSIIIPLYNTPMDFFIDCLESVREQALSKSFMEVIIVDDCSTEDYSKVYNEFNDLNLVIERLDKNSGPGVARRIGIEKARGKYITFLDSDDQFYNSTALQILYNTALKNQRLDIICGRVVEELENGDLLQHEQGYVWCFAKFFKKEFLEKNQINFNSTRANEDNSFCTLCSLCTDEIYWIEDTVYLWRFQPSSITRRDNHSYEYKGFRSYIDNMVWVYEECKKRGIENSKKCLFQYCSVWIRIYLHFLQALQKRGIKEAVKVLEIGNYYYESFYKDYRVKLVSKTFLESYKNMILTSIPLMSQIIVNISFPEFEYRAINKDFGDLEPKFEYYLQ